MSSKIVVVCLVLATTVGTSHAGIDSIGLYLDSNGQDTCLQGGVGSLHSIFLIIKNPSIPGSVGGWQGTLHSDSGLSVVGVVLEGSGMNFLGGNDYMVGLGSPIPWSPEVLLATFSVFATSAGGMCFDALVGGDEETPVYSANSELRNLYLEYGGDGNPSVTIGLQDCPELNGADSVSTEQCNWSSVKSIFR